jgi:hypothetical protein
MITSTASELARRAPSLFEQFEEQVEEELARTRREARDEAKRRSPVDTGALRASIRIDEDAVVADADHAIYVHEGHVAPDGSYVEANPFLEEAARQALRNSIRRLTR